MLPLSTRPYRTSRDCPSGSAAIQSKSCWDGVDSVWSTWATTTSWTGRWQSRCPYRNGYLSPFRSRVIWPKPARSPNLNIPTSSRSMTWAARTNFPATWCLNMSRAATWRRRSRSSAFRTRRWPSWWPRWPRPCTMRIRRCRGSCTGTSSRPTSCSTPRPHRSWQTSAWRCRKGVMTQDSRLAGLSIT